ncbi:putative cyclophilin type peptidyl-prolyl cis-trans isomerase [Trypanosoma theileri]|uniref:peptidylprolyl isomerase n=1 Tax=Trypanosoma theileri TaxID=67003 RepID=A0A1X0P6X3_9TRYP|nr:putative cyclophilin type peptidyl-prolyl cis-trans isomerase [Trypanosoma theileri]ORC92682.1 putative cyclophilin type peptidyl-prolyl cis-trans isomerase [Trypanosoma theileri]
MSDCENSNQKIHNHHQENNNNNNNSSSDDDDDEDFLPSIPEALLHNSQNETAVAGMCSAEITREKRPRSPSGEHETLNSNNNDNIHKEIAEDVNMIESDDKKEEMCVMKLLNSEGYPTPSLYERSYRHDSIIHDVALVKDELGALIVTVDAMGTLRAWRKLPRGVFFMGERQGLFPQSDTDQEREMKKLVEHHVLADSLTSSLFVVRVTPRVEMIAGVVTVFVEIRRVNPTLMAVESRLSFQFSATLRNKKALSYWKETVTPQPFLLHYEYEPYIVFFTSEPNGSSGVILFPCFSKRSLGDNAVATLLPSRPLSTANIVLCCQQHRPSGLVVLVDEKGIIDYARMMTSCDDEGNMIISLSVVPGVPSRGAADPMMLRKWITFERRQKTGFFTLLRESVTNVKSCKTMIPLSVRFSPSGKYFVVTSCILYNACVCVCSHLFDFASGGFLCRGETEEVSVPQLRDEESKAAALLSLRGAVFDVVVEEAVGKVPQSGRVGGVWVFVPEIGVTSCSEERVGGRRIYVFRASIPTTTTTTSSNSTKMELHMEQLPRQIGDVEKNIRETPLQGVLSTTTTTTTTTTTRKFSNSWRLAAPLVLLRLAIPASQALKNLVAQSPVGLALSQEDVKRLFVVPSSADLAAVAAAAAANGGSTSCVGADDPMFCTTSLGENALLLYTNYEASIEGIALGRDIIDTATADMDADMLKLEQIRHEKILTELTQKRDFNCGDLQQLQSSVQAVAPRETEETDNREQDKKESISTRENDIYEEEDTDVEDRRVKHIITASTSRNIEWGDTSMYASFYVSSFGKITVHLMPSFAPKTVENFIGLVRQGFYDGLTFHRVVPGFMIQGGCPMGDGTGGKSIFGGTFEDEGLNIMEYFLYPSVYWLCMANRGPNTNESQFFITVGETAPWLNGKHTVFGFVVGGKSVVQAIVQTPKGEDDKPLTPVVMERVVVTEKSNNN